VVSVSCSQGTWSHAANSYTFSLGNLPPAATAQISITSAATVAGSMTNLATVSAAELDPNHLNNAVAYLVSVLARPVLTCAANGPNLTLTWSGPGILQSATNVTGPFINLPGVLSPYVVNTTGAPQRFFRVYGP
jgi:hypothetical protein